MLDYYDDVAGESRWLGAAIIGLLSVVVVGAGIWTFAGSGNANNFGTRSLTVANPTFNPRQFVMRAALRF